MSSRKFQYLYRLDGKCYLDHPEWTQGHNSIICRKPLKNFDLFLEKNKNIVFVIYRDFGDGSSVPKPEDVALPPSHISESIRLIDKRLLKFFEAVLERNWRYDDKLRKLRRTGEIDAPYLFVYHHRRSWKNLASQCRSTVREHLALLTNYVSHHFGHEYEAADTLFAQRKISAEYVKYLFQPGDILVTKEGGHYRGVVASSWPGEARLVPSDAENIEDDIDFFALPSASDRDSTDTDEDARAYSTAAILFGPQVFSKPDQLPRGSRHSDHANIAPKAAMTQSFSIDFWKWSFDGEFKREVDTNDLRLSPGPSGERREWNLHDLEVYPLRFAPKSVISQLRRRGEMLWMCRKRSMVSYRETLPGAQEEVSTVLIDTLSSYLREP